MTQRAPFVPVALASVLAWTVPVAAQDQRAAAQVLFEQGRALVETGSFAEACPKLAESLKLDPGLGTMLWLADCYENNGQTASAWAEFKDATAKAALARDSREKVARDRAANLEKRLSRLQIVVPPAASEAKGVEIRRDGVVVGSAELGAAIPVDPGVHTVAAAAPGKKPWSAIVKIPQAPATTAVTIPVLETGEAPARGHRPAGGDTPSGAAEPDDPSAGNTQRAAGLAVGGVGLAALGVGTVFSFKAKSTYDASNAKGHCVDNRCDAAGLSLRDDAKAQALVATITLGVGAAALASGVVLFFAAPRRAPVAVSPAAGPQGAGLDVVGRF